MPPSRVGSGGVSFETDPAGLCQANLHLRTASRILVRLAEFPARDFRAIEKHAKKIDWDRFTRAGDVIGIRVSCKKSRLYHQRAVGDRFADVMRAAGLVVAGRGSPEDDAPRTDAQTLYVRLFRDRCTASIDSTGEHLHRRGYRRGTAKAPLRETLAAAALMAVGWDPTTPLVDPLCGSGTLPIEGALMARSRAPGLHRVFASERWPVLGRDVWHGARRRAEESLNATVPFIAGSDRDEGAVRIASGNGKRAHVEEDITWSCRALSSAEAPSGSPAGLLIANPPYGRRIGKGNDLRDLYAALGNVARRAFGGWTLGVIATDSSLIRQLGIPMEQCLSTRHGGLSIGVWRGVVPKD